MTAFKPIPSEIRCAGDYATLAPQFIPEAAFAHLAAGSAQDRAAAANLGAFAACTITPRLLRDVTRGDTIVNLPGGAHPHPILLAPLAYQALYADGAELDTARAAGATETCLICSTLSSCTLEDIAAVAGPARWFQLYFQPQRDVTLDLVRRAERAGYGAIVLTLDTPVRVPSFKALRSGVPETRAGNLSSPFPEVSAPSPEPGQSGIFGGMMRHAPLWPDLDWLLAQTTLPLWIKGVMHPDDARALVQRGVTGIVVSNHGGRALDSAPASLAALPSIRAALGDAFPVLFDGGIRSGADIFKAIALGADAVMVGRLQAYALGVAGALGVAHMIRLLREELELCMALAGCASLADIRQADVRLRQAQPMETAGAPC
ncbi:alpha-hydroxy acid oxidase [Emcibacter sp. SYSU 3D8]|uniref:alpha-hydroxy acid oxidase n=1 Tax=Emcibacter sp. SYSU 3D8 TaxID=3133969 RepID=UPI0031FEF8DB